MKTAKLIISIIALCLVFVILFQSCAAGIGNALSDDEDDISGTAGFFTGICYLIGGIVGICTRKSRGGSITAGIFFLVGAFVGFCLHGSYTDLIIWSIIAAAFGIVFILGAGRKPQKQNLSDK